MREARIDLNDVPPELQEAVAAAVVAVELADSIGADQLDREMAVLDPGRRQGCAGGGAQALRDVVEVEGQSDFVRSA